MSANIRNRPITRYKRKLPHLRQEGATYFATFHTSDSLPRKALDDLERLRDNWLRENPLPHDKSRLAEYNRLIAIRTEQWLHQGYGACPFNHFEHRQRLYDALLHFHGNEDDREKGKEVRVEIAAFTVMPNHVHLAARPLAGYPLEDWLGSVKQFVSRRIPPDLKPRRELWFRESHDRIVRDLKHLNNCVRYIGRNPVNAGISPKGANVLWINPDWKALGWSLGV